VLVEDINYFDSGNVVVLKLQLTEENYAAFIARTKEVIDIKVNIYFLSLTCLPIEPVAGSIVNRPMWTAAFGTR